MHICPYSMATMAHSGSEDARTIPDDMESRDGGNIDIKRIWEQEFDFCEVDPLSLSDPLSLAVRRNKRILGNTPLDKDMYYGGSRWGIRKQLLKWSRSRSLFSNKKKKTDWCMNKK